MVNTLFYEFEEIFSRWLVHFRRNAILHQKNTLEKIEIQFIIESPYWMLCSPYRKGYSISVSPLVEILPIKVNDLIQPYSIKCS